MRSTVTVAIVVACIGGLGLAACNRQQAQTPPPPPPAQEAPPEAAPAAPASDLSADASQKYLADNAKKPGVTVRSLQVCNTA